MEKAVSKDRLNGFFLDMTRRSFFELGINDAQVTRYVADVMSDFAHTDKLYRVHSRSGRRLDSVVEILAAAEEAPSGETPLMRERRLRKYLGDYTLFMSGFFRSHVERGGFLDYYLKEGRASYWTVSELDLSRYRTGFVLFQELSEKFEYFSGALDYMQKAYFAPGPGRDPFAGFLKRIEGWMKVSVSDN